jgi:hypothetical protein
MSLDAKDARRAQTAMNHYIDRYPKIGHAKLLVDGVWGAHSKAMVRAIKYDLGYVHSNIDSNPNEAFYDRMAHPNHVDLKVGATKEAVKRGQKRRRTKRRKVAANRIRAVLTPGVTTFDGVPVAKCAVPILRWCREHGWAGKLVSGWRSPAYSESLCINMCGRPSCPGRCAGRSTNHSGNSPARFAMDVSDYFKFADVVADCPIAPKVHNALPNDRVHFSPSGG